MTNRRTREHVRYILETAWGSKLTLDATDDETALQEFHDFEPIRGCNKGSKKTLVREVRTVLAEGKL